MSTTYMTRVPMTIDQARALVTGSGGKVLTNDDGKEVWQSPDGDYVHPGVPGDYVPLSLNEVKPGEEPTPGITTFETDPETGKLREVESTMRLDVGGPLEPTDGLEHVMVERYGGNDPGWFEGLLDLVSEHDPDYDLLLDEEED